MAAGDLTTLSKLKQYLGEKTNEKDPLLKQMITSSSAWIRNWLNRDILSASYTRTFNGTGGRGIFLAERPVLAVASVKVDGVALASDRWALVGSSVTMKEGGWPLGVGNIEITWTGGYATVPAEIDQACIELVAWRMHEKVNLRRTQGSIGGETINFQTTDLPPGVATILKNFRNVVPA